MKKVKRKSSKTMLLYVIDINAIVSDKQYKLISNIISAKTKSRISKFKFPDDKKRTMFGEILVRYAISKKMKVASTKIVLDEEENGKPYCKNVPEIHYNISHSGSWVICAVSKNPIGVDIEKIESADLQIAKRFFSNQEYDLLLQQENRAEMFYKLWTLKESYIKYTGKGLSTPLSAVEFRFKDNKIELKSSKINALHFVSEKLFENYYVSICSEERYESIEVKQITFKEIEKLCVI